MSKKDAQTRIKELEQLIKEEPDLYVLGCLERELKALKDQFDDL